MEQRQFEPAPAPLPPRREGLVDVDNLVKGPEGSLDKLLERQASPEERAVQRVMGMLASKDASPADLRDMEEYREIIDGVEHHGLRMKYPNIRSAEHVYSQADTDLRAQWERELKAGDDLTPFAYRDDSGNMVKIAEPDRYHARRVVKEHRLSRVAAPAMNIPAQRQTDEVMVGSESVPERVIVSHRRSTPKLGLGRLGAKVTAIAKSKGAHRS